LVDKYHEELFK